MYPLMSLNRLEINRLWDLPPEGALRELDSAQDLQPPALTLRGIARYRSGDPSGAAADLNAVLASEPENPVATLYRGLSRFGLGEEQQASADLKAAPVFPDRRFIRTFLAAFWPLRFTEPALRTFRTGHEESAEPMPFDADYQALAANPDAPQKSRARLSAKLRAAAHSHASQEQETRAGELFRRAWELEPENAELALEYAAAANYLGQPEEALRVLEPLVEKALSDYESEPKLESLPDPLMVTQWATALHETGQHEAALAVIARIRPDGPEDYGAHLLAALCWLMLGREKEADAAFDAALGPWFFDSWNYTVRPFYMRVAEWLEGPSEDQQPAG